MLPGRILIANRGEIACRVIAACRELGIEAIAVYAEPDAGSLHVRLADQAVPIGGASPADSYLRGDRIVEAALATGATAIHPGYGFLSERADFAAACAAAGITFIGPSPEAMRMLGNKIAAKELAARVGVPILSDYHGADQSTTTLAREAASIGYPILIKAAAGGAGRGMRVVDTPEHLEAAAEAAAREAANAFGDPTVFLERYVARPRHIEVQILADSHGTVLALGERECSVQRRHQKVIEETPSPAVDPTLRLRLYEAAVSLARAAGYVNAGTVEFLLDPDGLFYFLEMNSRLQVEHPVTELITGLDLVAAQIRIAAGSPLGLSQQDIALRGHAIEARLYAEDPAHGFVPATGTLLDFDLPHLPGVRIDTGVVPGDTVGVNYDPMVAKVIAYGDTRAAALARLVYALARCRALGVTTNRAYLQRILAHPDFAGGNLSTRFLDEHEHDLLPMPSPPDLVFWLAAALAFIAEEETGAFGPQHAAPPSLWRAPGQWRHRASFRTAHLRSGDTRRSTSLQALDDDRWRALLDGEEIHLTARRRGDALTIQIKDATYTLHAVRAGMTVYLSGDRDAATFTLAEPPSAVASGDHGGGNTGLRAPMPGVVVKVHVREGQHVEAYQPLLALEAMKMEHVIVAPFAGAITRLPYGEGSLVPANAVLAEMEER